VPIDTLYPEQTQLRGFAGAITPEQIEAANRQYRDFYDTWSANVDRAAMATFQLSGQQLDDLQKDPENFQAYLDDLLSTPDGQMKAMMAGNQLAAIQIQEARQLRELMATSIQSQLQSRMKGEKLGQTQEEFWREMTRTDKLKNLVSKPDPF
jgi:P-type conjugative transfer protein TrbJ